jgi:hypothetical protein
MGSILNNLHISLTRKRSYTLPCDGDCAYKNIMILITIGKAIPMIVNN